MAVNPPSDGGYNYYHKNLEELSDELRNQAKRAQVKAEEREDRLGENLINTLRKKDEETERTIANHKENSNDTIAKERAYNRAEVDRIKAQTYDREGRYNGQEADVLKQQLKNATEAWDLQNQSNRRNLTDAEKAYNAKLEETLNSKNAELEEKVKLANESASEAYSKRYASEKDAYDQQKVDNEKKNAELNRAAMAELNEQRRNYEKAMNDQDRNFKHRVSAIEESGNNRVDERQKRYDERAEKDTRTLNDARAAEARMLRGQMKDLLDAESHYIKSKAQGTQDAIQEYDNEWRARLNTTQDAYGKEIDALKRSANESDEYHNYQFNQTMKEKDAYFAGVIAKTNQENHQDKQLIANTFNADRKQLEMRNQRDREQSQKTMESQLNEANLTRDEALRRQAQAYQNTIQNIRTSDNTQIQGLQKELLTKTTTEDVNNISPAAEAAVRKSVLKEYDKSHTAEMQRSQGAIDSIQREYAGRLTDTIEDAKTRENLLNQQFAAENHHDRKELLTAIQDTEFLRDQTLRNQELDHTRQSDNLTRNYAQMLNGQRKQYEEILNASKNDASFKLQATRQDLEFNSKMSQRAFNARQNELIRDYEKKLTDQKTEFTTQIADLKSSTDRQLRDAERKNRIALDEQARSYEQRLTQQEVQHQERERYLTASFQEDLEKMKRSNAALIQKKS